MGCSSCGSSAKSGVAYPREITLPDGTKMTVTSAANERTERERWRQRERENARARGYTVGG
jgi:hypothetical protein